MKKINCLWMLLVAVFTLGLASCGDDGGENLPDGAVTEKDCNDTKTLMAPASSFTITFTAAGAWTASTSDLSWCTVMPKNGSAGSNKITVSVTQHTGTLARKAGVKVNVPGYREALLCTVTQNGGGSGADVAVNAWVEKYMREAYMWNEAIDNVPLDNTLSFDKFLPSILEGVAMQKDGTGRSVNYDDGHWKDGKRKYFYSNISLSEASRSTRAGETYTDTGILTVINGYVQDDPYIGGLIIMGVAPGTSADLAGLKRGHMVTEVDGEKFSQDMSAAAKEAFAQKLITGSGVRVVANEVYSKDGVWYVTPLDEMLLTSTTYKDPAIYKRDVVQVGDTKVAYLLYMAFSTEFDQDLFDAFDYFKAEGATELILDLRYNGGGHVRSSTLLSTLIVGNEYKDQTYVRTTYNATRTAKGEPAGVYRIGNSSVSDGDGVYTPIAEALNHSLNLKRIYVICSEDTASASELVINGLRGLDLEVRLIGMQTNGKNVGMEGYADYKVGENYYDFLPVTFYAENAKGFKDYSEGFVPDVIFDDTGYYPGDFGTTEDGFFLRAASWIRTGEKPVANSGIQKAPRMVTTDGYRSELPKRHRGGSLIILNAE